MGKNILEDSKLFNDSEGPAKKEKKELINGLPEELTRFACIAEKADIKFINDYAYTKRLTIKEAFHEMIDKFKQEYQSNPKNEKLLEKPKGKR